MNSDGMSSTIRKHLAETHWDDWVAGCRSKGIKIRGTPWEDLAAAEAVASDQSGNPGPHPTQPINVPVHVSYSMDAFIERLTRWIVSDDQVSVLFLRYSRCGLMLIHIFVQAIRVVDNPYFRELLEYSSFGNLTDDDIPHRTKMTELIFDAYHYEKDAMKKEMNVCTD